MMAIHGHMRDVPALGQRPPEGDSSVEEEEYEEGDESEFLSQLLLPFCSALNSNQGSLNIFRSG